MNRRTFLAGCCALSGCATQPGVVLPNGQPYHPIHSFRWFRARNVEEVKITLVETPDAAQMCAVLYPHVAAAACAYEFGPERIIYAPPGDMLIQAHEALHCLGWDHDMPEWAKGPRQ